MGELVLGAGASHSPLLSLPGPEWTEWAQSDRTSGGLVDAAGRQRSWQDLSAEAGDRYAADITEEACVARAHRADVALDQLAREIRSARLDAVVVVGDDEDEHLLSSNRPPILVYQGESIRNRTAHDGMERSGIVARSRLGYLEDGPDRDYPVAVDFAQHLISTMIDSSIDVASSDSLLTPQLGMGHAFSFPLRRLLPPDLPIVPVMINTYFPPSQPRAARCIDYGWVLRRAIESFEGARIGVLASGGLSHMVVMPEVDERALDAFARDAVDELAEIPESVLQSGTSEIKNWITVGAACRGLAFRLIDYIPAYRSAAGTGVGLAFARWGGCPA